MTALSMKEAVDFIAAESPGHMGDVLGALRYIADAHPGEPLFVIRGRDVLAFPALTAGYIGACQTAGLTGENSQIERAWRHAARFAEWQRENAKLTHLPDPLPRNPTPPLPGTETYRVGRDM